MSSENTVRTFEFIAAGPGPWVPASNSLLVQTSVGVSVEAVTLIGQSPEVLGSVAANDFDRYDTAHAFVRLVANGAGSAAISASIPTPAGAGGGGSSDATEATQLLVKTAVEAINTKTPTVGRKAASGSTPVTLPSDIPTDLVADSAGTLFSPGSCSHAYGYDGSGNLTTDTATDGAVVRVKTLAYTSGNMTTESKWVVQ